MKKQRKKIKINDHSIRNITITITISIFAIVVVIFVIYKLMQYQISKKVVTTLNPQENLLHDNAVEWFVEEKTENAVNIEEIILKNLQTEHKETIETKVVELEYETEYEDNHQLPKGMVKVLQQGQDGVQELIIRKQYEGDKLISDEQVGRKITQACINKIVQVGTASYYDRYTIKKGDTVYSTPYTLDLRKTSNKTAETLISVNQDSQMKVIKLKKGWYYVQYGPYYGWVEEDCVTHINPGTTNYNNNTTSKNKQQLLAQLSKNMNVMKPSGLSLAQFKKILSNNRQDKNKVFEKNAEYFYYIEKQYGINGVFVAAIGIHESAWGTSKIAINKRNLFGYGAYDKSAYTSAYSYQGYAASIDMIARVLVKNYLNPKGTSIYNGEVASGAYYYGRTIKSVNTKYATDKNWHNSVYQWMKYLYQRL